MKRIAKRRFEAVSLPPAAAESSAATSDSRGQMKNIDAGRTADFG